MPQEQINETDTGSWRQPQALPPERSARRAGKQRQRAAKSQQRTHSRRTLTPQSRSRRTGRRRRKHRPPPARRQRQARRGRSKGTESQKRGSDSRGASATARPVQGEGPPGPGRRDQPRTLWAGRGDDGGAGNAVRTRRPRPSSRTPPPLQPLRVPTAVGPPERAAFTPRTGESAEPPGPSRTRTHARQIGRAHV